MRTAVTVHLIIGLFAAFASGQTTFVASFDPAARAEPATGRLVVHLVAADSTVASAPPAAGPFWSDPQPIYAIDVTGLKPGETATVPPTAAFPDGFPHPPAELPAGRYVAQAVLDVNRLDSSWRREPGNLYGSPVPFEVRVGEPNTVTLTMDKATAGFEFPAGEGAEEVVVDSTLLSDFHGSPQQLKAGVVPPLEFDEDEKYAAIYVIGGFGGRHDEAVRYVGRTRGTWAEIRRRAFVVVLDPETPNGHSLFVDSRVNGPHGSALTQELIPAIEAKYPQLVAEPAARIVTGHSSGGWASLWLGVTYPETFGAVFSSGPDPVDFRRFELIDIYNHANAYADDRGEERPAARFEVDGEMAVTMTVREEVGGETVLRPDFASGQQWASWMACWGTKGGTIDGYPVPRPLFDARTGEIDPEEAEAYKAFDIRLLLANDPARYGPIFRDNVRLVCGRLDNYYLNEAVELLAAEVEKHAGDADGPGYVELVEGADHGGSLFRSEIMRAWPRQVIEHLDRHELGEGSRNEARP